MKKYWFCLFLIILSFSTRAQSAGESLTNAGIIEMYKTGLTVPVMLASIESSNCKFNTSATGLIALKKAGIDQTVIKAMIEKQNVSKELPASGHEAPVKAVVSKRTSSKMELLNHVYYLETGSKASRALEKSTAGIRTKQSPFGSSILLQIDGASSSLRLNTKEAMLFAINTGSTTTPELVLYQVKVVKGKREVPTMKANTFSGVKTGENVITLDIASVGEGIYKIAPGKSLSAGEYFFTGKPSTSSVTMDAFTFGVD